MSLPDARVLFISDDAARCSAFRSALMKQDSRCWFSFVASFAAARHALATVTPDVIVLEEGVLHPGAAAVVAPRNPPLADAVTLLAGYAPVIVLGVNEPPPALATLIAAGAAEFVSSVDADLPKAVASVELRLQSIRRSAPVIAEALPRLAPAEPPTETFGEMLRHELNNPLTGILGNAELLLAETRRSRGASISDAGAKRLETIAALAVRMRETVRRLSQACEPEQEREADQPPSCLSSDLPSHSPLILAPRRT